MARLRGRYWPEAEESIVTTGKQLIEQGRQQGFQQAFQESFQQGLQEGFQQGFRKPMLRLLRQRFGDGVNEEVERRIGAASLEQLETWAVRVLTAATLSELLAD